MFSQRDKIHKTDWDILIILDTCRYDYFREEYKNYLNGELSWAISSGKDTAGWLAFTWTNYYNLTYYSTTPYINNKNIRWETNSWKPTEHFSDMVDIWRTGWDDKLGTVPPHNVNETVKKLYSGEKAIIHYMQPHGPWIGTTNLKLGKKEDLYDIDKSFLKEAYVDNLKLVLNYVKDIVEFLGDKKIIITSDHGEMLGENDQYLHPSSEPEVRIVPWLETFKYN